MRDKNEVLSEVTGLVVDEILNVPVGVWAAAGHDMDGQQYLLVELDRRWACAPISPLALHCVATGQAELSDAFRHSLTGYVVVVTCEPSGDASTSIRLCNDILDDLLPHRPAVLAA